MKNTNANAMTMTAKAVSADGKKAQTVYAKWLAYFASVTFGVVTKATRSINKAGIENRSFTFRLHEFSVLSLCRKIRRDELSAGKKVRTVNQIFADVKANYGKLSAEYVEYFRKSLPANFGDTATIDERQARELLGKAFTKVGKLVTEQIAEQDKKLGKVKVIKATSSAKKQTWADFLKTKNLEVSAVNAKHPEYKALKAEYDAIK